MIETLKEEELGGLIEELKVKTTTGLTIYPPKLFREKVLRTLKAELEK